ncbi:hypothetical protein GCM10011274_20410 [Paraglaciecola chathamensis]|uniref:Uncharacterized protein n=1 Tax=Paraglaciecola chathamensis TaxID=368405 RepID=A0A8H9M0U8_9ALTE|nr:hypothetical protein GCM10011274_20410 [Paraglaciecola oceanifecundans]
MQKSAEKDPEKRNSGVVGVSSMNFCKVNMSKRQSQLLSLNKPVKNNEYWLILSFKALRFLSTSTYRPRARLFQLTGTSI